MDNSGFVAVAAGLMPVGLPFRAAGSTILPCVSGI